MAQWHKSLLDTIVVQVCVKAERSWRRKAHSSRVVVEAHQKPLLLHLCGLLTTNVDIRLISGMTRKPVALEA